MTKPVFLQKKIGLTEMSKVKRTIQWAKANGCLDKLYWYVECLLPPERTQSGDPVLQGADYPRNLVPVVPVGDNPALSLEWIEILAELFRQVDANEGIQFGVCVTDRETLGENTEWTGEYRPGVDFDWYVWGDATWDTICAVCGAVTPMPIPSCDVCDSCRASGAALFLVVDELEEQGQNEQSS